MLGRFVNNLERMWKREAVAYHRVLFYNMSVRSEESHEKSVKKAGSRAKTRNRDFPNTEQNANHYAVVSMFSFIR
jgi:hypothetical protein